MQIANVKITNGTITLPKPFIEQLNLKGDRMGEARIEGGDVVIGLGKNTKAPYRIFSNTEIAKFIKDDELPQLLAKQVQSKLSKGK